MPSMMSVHPRWRGEHYGFLHRYTTAHGSSPLARGTPTDGDYQSMETRFIPAGAGNTCADSRGWSPSTVHPRWRGEHVIVGNLGYITTGSSPLARGTLHRAEPHRRALRFIPAGAGNTAPALSRRPGFSVHPRWRGEHVEPCAQRRQEGGSSPLARGTPAGGVGQGRRQRFIPAGAGNTGFKLPLSMGDPVHPRWRGEHFPERTQRQDGGGSSPLARGTHLA